MCAWACHACMPLFNGPGDIDRPTNRHLEVYKLLYWTLKIQIGWISKSKQKWEQSHENTLWADVTINKISHLKSNLIKSSVCHRLSVLYMQVAKCELSTVPPSHPPHCVKSAMYGLPHRWAVPYRQVTNCLYALVEPSQSADLLVAVSDGWALV